MKNNKGFKLIKKAVSCTLLVTTLITCSGCVKEVDCKVSGKHIHLYLNNDSKLSRYIEGEKETVSNFLRTENYLTRTKELAIISDNELYIVSDNLEYLEKQEDKHYAKRQAYVYDYIYGTYYGYDYGYDPMTGGFDYHYGLQTGWHYDHEWQDISLDKYTTDKVRDVTYQFKFYKINNDGSLSSKLFDSIKNLTEEYKYFKTSDLIKTNISESYYLEKEKQNSIK